MPDAPVIYERATEYTVCALPDDFTEVCHDMRYHWELTVEWRGHDRWAVMNGAGCLSAAGKWDYEPRPSGREDPWLATHRFTLAEAMRLAREQALLVTVNGHAAADELERYRKLKAARRA